MNENRSVSIIKDTKTLGLLVCETRKKANLTQKEAAALCGVGTRFFSDLENGKATLQLGKVLHILHSLGLLMIIQRKVLVHE